MNSEFLHITDAQCLSGYCMRLVFSNWEERIFDFSKVYSRGIFTKLKDKDYFSRFTLDGWTVDWNNEIGFAPEFLYTHSTPAA